MTKYYLIDGKYYKTNFKVGDVIQVGTSNYKDYRLRPESPSLKIVQIRDQPQLYSHRAKTEYSEINPGKYAEVYSQELKLEGLGNAYYNALNFKLKETGMGSKILAIGVERPCVVWLLQEVINEDGTVTSSRVGEPVSFVNMQAAQAWAQKQIQDKIRADNVYQKYSIFEERFVAAAKEPPVVFE